MPTTNIVTSLIALALSTLFAVDATAQVASTEPTATTSTEGSGSPRPGPTIEYLANEGVLLTAGDEAVLIAPGDAIDALSAEAGGLEAFGDRLRPLSLAPGETASVDMGVNIEMLGLAHAGIGHVAYRVEFPGMTVLHLGDAQPTPDDLTPLLATGERPDIALIPFWVLTGENRAELIATIDARCAVAMHLERQSADIVSRLAERVPMAFIFDEPGERVGGDC